MDINKLPDMQAIPEVDDFHIARMIVSEQAITSPEQRLWYLALWLARLRETYVQVGRDVQKNDGCGIDGS